VCLPPPCACRRRVPAVRAPPPCACRRRVPAARAPPQVHVYLAGAAEAGPLAAVASESADCTRGGDSVLPQHEAAAAGLGAPKSMEGASGRQQRAAAAHSSPARCSCWATRHRHCVPAGMRHSRESPPLNSPTVAHPHPPRARRRRVPAARAPPPCACSVLPPARRRRVLAAFCRPPCAGSARAAVMCLQRFAARAPPPCVCSARTTAVCLQHARRRRPDRHRRCAPALCPCWATRHRRCAPAGQTVTGAVHRRCAPAGQTVTLLPWCRGAFVTGAVFLRGCGTPGILRHSTVPRSPTPPHPSPPSCRLGVGKRECGLKNAD